MSDLTLHLSEVSRMILALRDAQACITDLVQIITTREQAEILLRLNTAVGNVTRPLTEAQERKDGHGN